MCIVRVILIQKSNLEEKFTIEKGVSVKVKTQRVPLGIQ